MVRVNRPTVGAAFNAPFGGIKQSGTGTHQEQLGPTVMDFYTVHAHGLVGELTWTSSCTDRRALVLGSSSGLGRAVAAALVAEGATVAVVSRSIDRRAAPPPTRSAPTSR